jgi:hypothetical protein
MIGLGTLGESGLTNVKVDGEEAVLHITDQSVMFEKAGKVSGFERSAIRMVKPDGDAMIIAYSAGSEVKSVRIEPVTAVASLLVSSTDQAHVQAPIAGLDEVFEKLYRDTRRELEERLAKIQADPGNKNLRLAAKEEERYSQVSRQLESIVSSKFGFGPRTEDSLISFWGLEKQPTNLQLYVVKTLHISFLRVITSLRAEKSDIVYSGTEVWPEDWQSILNRFGLDGAFYSTEGFASYLDYLKKNWKYNPGERKPTLARH